MIASSACAIGRAGGRYPLISEPGDGVLDFLLLAGFLIFNFFLLRWVIRRLVVEAEWLRDPEERAEVLREYGLEKLKDRLPGGVQWNRDNPMFKLLEAIAFLIGILGADYITIRERWPWLLGG
jgi:hypothetical protein